MIGSSAGSNQWARSLRARSAGAARLSFSVAVWAVNHDAAAYSAGNAFGTIQSIAALRASPGTGLLETVQVVVAEAIAPTLVLAFFSATPAAATDHSAYNLSYADQSLLLGSVVTTAADFTTIGTTMYARFNPAIVLKAAAGGNVFCLALATGTLDYVGATVIKVILGVLQD